MEKPARGKEPSREASIGRFLYAPDFLDQLEEEWTRHGKGEFYHTPAVLALARKGRVVFHRVQGERLDTGEPAGYLEAIIRYARGRSRAHRGARQALRESRVVSPERVVLIGFMGSGKTTVGRILAERLGWDFADTDDSCGDARGCADLRNLPHTGRAPGSGNGSRASSRSSSSVRASWWRPGAAHRRSRPNRDFFTQGSAVFYLRVSLATALKRARSDSGRPLLAQKQNAISALYENRRSLYEELGTAVDTERKSPADVAEQIMMLLPNPRR